MIRMLKECQLDDKCAYLDGLQQTTHYKVLESCSSTYCQKLVERGWRRFGNIFFRPLCKECDACKSVKIDVKNYVFSRSERRTIRKNRHLRTVMQRPAITQRHLELFNTYHAYMKEHRGWGDQSASAQHYFTSFVNGCNDYGYEILYYDKELLVGVDLIDILPDGISSIYFYYDPEYAKYSLGRYSLYRQIMAAKAMNLSWIYLGYCVDECQSLKYKRNYTPQFQLVGHPDDDSSAVWEKVKSEK